MKLFWRIWTRLTKPAALVAWIGAGAKAVPQAEANFRAAMCIHCPGNQKSSALVDFTAHAIRQKLGRETPYDCCLESCAGCGCDLKLKVHVPYGHIKAWQKQEVTEKIRSLKKDCWQI